MIPIHTAHGPIASSAHTAVAQGFNPVTDLTNLIWLIHPDDSVLVGGEIDSIVCRKSGTTFQAALTTRRLTLDTLERPGHQTALSPTLSGDFLTNSSGIASAFNGGGAFTQFLFKRETNIGSLHEWLQHSVGSGLNSAGDRIQWRMNGTSCNYQIVESGVASQYSNTVTRNNTTWRFWLRTWDGAGTVATWIDGVLIDTDTPVQTLRVPTGMTNILWGAGTTYTSVSGACTGVLGISDITNLTNWVYANA